MTEVLELLASFVVSTWLAFALVGFDERRLERRWPERAARGWPPASKMAALVVFGPLALVVHFVRTRRSLTGALVGVLAAAVVLAANLLAVTLVETTLPAPASMDHGAPR